MDSNTQPSLRDDFELKNELIDRVLSVGIAIGFAALLISCFPLNNFALNTDFFIDVSGLLVLTGTFYYKKKLSLEIKLNIISVILVALLVSDLMENGINTPDFILLVLIHFFAILVYPLRTMVLVYACTTVLFLGIGHLFHLGVLSSPNYDVNAISIFRWYETLMMLSAVTFVIAVFVDRYNNRVYSLILDLEKQNGELVNSQKQIKENLNEKNVLLQEIHHRVKNNLAVVSGLLSLQSHHIKDPTIKIVLGKSMNRILSIAKVHEMLYESQNFNNIPFNTYIRELSKIILDSMNDEGKSIVFKTDISVRHLSINQGVPLGIIFNELITNSVKYGFLQKEGNEIRITVKQEGEFIKVIYTDNGVGIEDFETASKKSLGFTLIHSLMEQIDAQYSYNTQGKFELIFTFPAETNKLKLP